MISTLDHIQTLAHDRTGWGREIVRFVAIFAVVSFVTTVVTNFSLFRSSLYDIVWGVNARDVSVHAVPHSFAFANQSVAGGDEGVAIRGSGFDIGSGDNLFSGASVTYHSESGGIIALSPQDQTKINHILHTHTPIQSDHVRVLAESLKESFSSYRLGFNTLPNQARVIIDRIAVNAPIIIPSLSKPIDQINEGEFDAELYKGVVKYPTTAVPGSPQGATLLFGHTSYEEWKHNPYANIFRNIPRLNAGDIIRLIWDGHEYSYRVTEKKLVRPREVNAQFLAYHTKSTHYLILMGCYPIGTTDKRILVIAERL
ncbi:MAG: class E sortase [Candidatus Absconditabacterales bacterium]|nr:class E sortase [Candidatus Absconditabacterales bacterium]